MRLMDHKVLTFCADDAHGAPIMMKADELGIEPAAFIDEINKLGPFGNHNYLPIFLIRNVKIIKSNIINKKHISAIVKPNIGSSLKSICFNCINTQIGEYLLSYKKNINIVAEINENIWNNKKSIQLNIKDLVL